MTKYRLTIILKEKYQFLQDISKIEEKQVKQELERRSTVFFHNANFEIFYDYVDIYNLF